jgi:hypothetical protein
MFAQGQTFRRLFALWQKATLTFCEAKYFTFRKAKYFIRRSRISPIPQGMDFIESE